jgi:hypothetical protein
VEETPQEPLPKRRRTHWIVDPAAQLGAVFTVVGIGATFLFFGVVIRFWNLRDGSIGLDSERASALALVADALFITFALVAVGVYVVWLTHRFVGPARVIRTALEGMAAGDHGRRLTLRKRDFLKDVAAAAGTVSVRMRSERDTTSALVDAIGPALEQGDVEAARAALRAFERRGDAAPAEPPRAATVVD